MVRKLRHTFFILILSASLAFAQETVPDFTVTDIHGETHQLYADYLNQDKTVVIDFFFANCGPCQAMAPSMQALYEDWGEGEHDVQFLGITILESDNDVKLTIFDLSYQITYPSISSEGGAVEAAAPYLDDDFGFFEGTPAIAIIAPDGTVQFDLFGYGPNTIDNVDQAIRATGATHPSEITSFEEVPELFDELTVTPNPAKDFATVNFNLNEPANVNIQVYNMIGQSVAEVFDGTQYPGYHQTEVNASQLRPGIYFIRVVANDEVRTIRFAKTYQRP